ncbi:hypothetical protein ACFE04_030988 [Oxalis oulophora]
MKLRSYAVVLSDHQTISPPFTFPGFLFLKVFGGEDDKMSARSSRDKFYSDLSKLSPPPRVQHSALEKQSVSPTASRIEVPIGRDLNNVIHMTAVPGYKVTEILAGGGSVLVEWRLETGCTHQVLVAEKESKITETEAASTGDAARLRTAVETSEGEIAHLKSEHVWAKTQLLSSRNVELIGAN